MLLPFEVFTVIVAVPAFFAVILPSLTETTAKLLLVHVQDWLAFVGVIVLVNVQLSPTPSVIKLLFKEILVG